ncbi:hypothetical protein LL912_00865 [Niabella sp. CC-SYL272]|uniref:hypothetical protein n=1 Tax=Niabella agricola TaxID=2891571 RepID=UPI001F3391E0|nr:hypothetical protein [Niabella agricola]MCF3107318.1 hypothetical protein [Niabella agricola]
MATVNLINAADTFVNPNDSIVIVDNFASIRGGRSLDVTGFTPDYIWGGHPIIQETATKEYKPLPLNGTNDGYGALPAGHTYAGILIATIPTQKPFAGILVQGTVNPKAMQFDSSAILSALKTALTLVDFRSDNQ